jgi:predicted DsbA family dithiol-disulfide isomerase
MEEKNMVDVKNKVDFYWDPVCPWCWITSRWMGDVSREKSIEVNWKLFSLKKVNENSNPPEHYKILYDAGLRALRVAAAVRKAHGNVEVGKIYTAMGARYHHDNLDIGKSESLVEILQTCGFPVRLAAAAGEDIWDKDIETDMAQAMAKAGTDVGVPLIVLDGGEGPGFFGPVFSPAPTGKAAVDLWDAIIVAGRTPGFFELKRTREIGPVLGERPKI